MKKVKKATCTVTGIEQYLALGAALHHIVDRIPTTAYPIRDWDNLHKAASSIDDLHLIVPGGKRSSLKEIFAPNFLEIRHIIGDLYFPIQDQQEFARKASCVLLTLVFRYFGSPSVHKKPNEQTAAAIEAFKRKLAAGKAH
jgi:hypothetical protein